MGRNILHSPSILLRVPMPRTRPDMLTSSANLLSCTALSELQPRVVQFEKVQAITSIPICAWLHGIPKPVKKRDMPGSTTPTRPSHLPCPFRTHLHAGHKPRGKHGESTVIWVHGTAGCPYARLVRSLSSAQIRLGGWHTAGSGGRKASTRLVSPPAGLPFTASSF